MACVCVLVCASERCRCGWYIDIGLFTACFSEKISVFSDARCSMEFFNTFAAFLYWVGTLTECWNFVSIFFLRLLFPVGLNEFVFSNSKHRPCVRQTTINNVNDSPLECRTQWIYVHEMSSRLVLHFPLGVSWNSFFSAVRFVHFKFETIRIFESEHFS